MIKLDNIHYGYKKGKDVLQDISFEMQPGRIYGILGKNGVGKTTILKLICGLLNPEKGKITVNEMIPFEKDREFLNKISFIQEIPYAPDIRIKDLAEITAPFYPTFDWDLLDKCLLEFEVPYSNSLQKMSLGQQKKAIISLAIACNTPILIMDEPTNGLDIPSKSTFRKLIASFADENRTILISTHQVRDLENLIDYILILENEGVLLNRSVYEIEEKLRFGEVKPETETLYKENSIKGCWGVTENNTGEPSNVDLEMLFNAVITNKQRIKDIFKI